MSEQVTVTPKSDSNPNASRPENQSVSLGISQLVSVVAVVLGISFFIPWVQFFGASLSGFDLQKLHGGYLLLWLIPILSAVTIFVGITKRGQRNAAQLAGIVPFCVLFYWLYRLGGDLMHIISFGGYLSLLSGAALLILPRLLK